MYFFMGFFGAAACLVMFGAGVVTGWSLCRLTRRRKPPKASQRDITAEGNARDDIQAQNVRRDIQAEQDAFRRLQNYSAEDAYGRNPQDESPLT